MITTEAEYLKALYCLECKYGEKVIAYMNKLRLGTPCNELKNDLMDCRRGIDILKCYDRRDIGLDDPVYNTFTLDDMQCLFQILNTKLQ